MESVEEWLSPDHDGHDSYGYGCGSGDGSGSGSGSGDGCGDGSGDGCGYCYGYGSVLLKSFCGSSIIMIDGIQTIIVRIKGNIAKGFMLHRDLTTNPCYVAKFNGYFAHGKTAKEAFLEAQEKAFEILSEEERISMFLKKFNFTDKYSTYEFF